MQDNNYKRLRSSWLLLGEELHQLGGLLAGEAAAQTRHLYQVVLGRVKSRTLYLAPQYTK